jgi:hypothetical protein
MSMSTPGDVRRPSTAKPKPAAGGKPGDGKAGGAGKPGAKAGGSGAKPGGSGTKPGGSGGGKGRKPIAPVKVSQGRNWGPIAMFAAAGVIAVLIIGFGAVQVWQQNKDTGPWEERATAIAGIVDYRKTEPEVLKAAQHFNGTLTYPQTPPVGGKHNPVWQNCQGDVYTAQLANEHAVHSMEHGTVWITYRPDLPADQIETLAKKVRGNSYMMLSPYPGLDKPISLQAWGFQLKVESAADGRIDEFIRALRQNATQEPGARCDGGITEPGLHDIQKVDPSAAPAG